MTDAVIVDVVRTASGRGKPGGALSGVHPAQLLASTIKALLDRTAVRGEAIDDVIAGCVAQVGDQALNIGRTASLVAGLPESVPGHDGRSPVWLEPAGGPLRRAGRHIRRIRYRHRVWRREYEPDSAGHE